MSTDTRTAEPISFAPIPGLTEPIRTSDLITILSEVKSLRAEIEAIKTDVQESYERLARDSALDRKRISRLESSPEKPSAKQRGRLNKLDQLLVARHNQAMTFSEIGKILELGSRSSDGKTTRRQAMTRFSKILLSNPDQYNVFRSKTTPGMMVKLDDDYYFGLASERKKM